jgi:hypothetical protein
MDLIATILALLALIAAVANDGYLGMLGSAAAKRPGTAEVRNWVKGQVPPAAGATLAALIALLMTSGGTGMDALAALVALGGGAVATRSLQSSRARFPTQR